MTDFFYRYRSAEALLDGFHELENQEIYFPTLKELNDPLEGYKDLVWRGDRIIWRNLLRHYLLCLMQCVSVIGIMGEDFTPELAANLVFMTDIDLPADPAPVRSAYAKVCETVLGHEGIAALITALSGEGKMVRRDELVFYLSAIHVAALANVLRQFEERGLKIVTALDEITQHADQALVRLPEMLRLHTLAEEHAEAFYFAGNNLNQQLALINELLQPVPDDRRSWLFLARDFPSRYVSALERLMYPDWHAACFVTDPTSAAMWGHYAAAHRGMCLKFKAKADGAGTPSLELNRPTSWGGGGRVGYSYVPHPFEPIDYSSAFPQIDFFESIGRLPIPKLRFWYDDPQGERSETGQRVLREDETWRQEYWQRFAASYRVKLPQWEYENEHRIVLHSNLADFESKESRKLKYKFEDLAGIVFGLNTSTEHKLAAMRIIEKKCVAEGRTDFEFWQAHYAHRTHQIELVPLGLIKISPGPADAEAPAPGM